MGKYFNTTGVCYPDEHYMVNIDSRLQEIVQLIGRGEYFTINRGRQFGKTTMISLLAERLWENYVVFSISFEGMEDEAYATSASFCQRLCRLLYKSVLYKQENGIPESLIEELKQMRNAEINLDDLSDFISECCNQVKTPVILIIDEVDQAAGQKIFLDFLGMLRKKFLARKQEPAFHSVILAGVYDVKNLKLKVQPEVEYLYNSPWNIAADFTVDMAFSAADIEGMLEEYEQDHHAGMDIPVMAEMLYEYTSGYPFMISRLCKLMDEKIPGKEEFPDKSAAWTKGGAAEAVKELLLEKNTLFDDMVKKLHDFPELKKMLYSILFHGERFPYNTDNHVIDIGVMFAFLKNNQGVVEVSNRIFEMRLYNLFLSEEMVDSKIFKAANVEKNQFIHDGRLDMMWKGNY